MRSVIPVFQPFIRFSAPSCDEVSSLERMVEKIDEILSAEREQLRKISENKGKFQQIVEEDALELSQGQKHLSPDLEMSDGNCQPMEAQSSLEAQSMTSAAVPPQNQTQITESTKVQSGHQPEPFSRADFVASLISDLSMLIWQGRAADALGTAPAPALLTISAAYSDNRPSIFQLALELASDMLSQSKAQQHFSASVSEEMIRLLHKQWNGVCAEVRLF